MGNDKEFGLGPIDGITHPPAAGNLPAVLIVSAIIRMHSAQAGATIAPGRDGTTEHSVTFLITFHCRVEFFYNADRLVPDGKARCHRILTFADMNVASTYRGSGYPNQSGVRADLPNRLFKQFDTIAFNKYGCFHGFLC